MSIKTKLTFMFLAIAVIPLLFVGALTYTNYKNSIESIRLSNLQDIAAFKADKIETYFVGLKGYIEIAQSFYNIQKNLPILTRLSGEPNSPDFLAAKKTLDLQLRHMQSVLGLSDMMLINPEGKIVYSSNEQDFLTDFLHPLPDPEQKAFENGTHDIFFSDIFLYKSAGDRFEMLITAPVHDFNNVFIGVVAFEVGMAELYKLVQDATGLGSTGETLLGKKVADHVLYLNPLRHDPNATLKRTVALGQKIGGPIQEAVQGKMGAGQLNDYRGIKVIAAWRYLPVVDWGMVAKIDTEEAFADVTNLRNLAFLILVIVFGLSAIMAFSIAKSIAEPIKKLSDVAAIVGRGNLDYKVSTSSNDEIGQLSRSFDKMTDNLKMTTASRDELNKEIAERRQAEEALQASHDRLKKVVEVEAVGVMFWDLTTGCLVDANGTFLKMMGYSRTDVETHNLTWQKFTPPEYHEVSLAEIRKFQVTGRVGPYEKEYFRKDGSRQWLLFAGSSLGGNQCVEFCVDISDCKQAEKDIQQRVEELQRLNNAMAGREMRMVDLKKEVNELCQKLGLQKRYPLDFDKEQQ